MTTCGCCECIAAVLPLCNGIMTVNREYTGMTPSGMKSRLSQAQSAAESALPVLWDTVNIISASGNSSWLTAAAAHGLDAKNAQGEIGDRLKARATELGVPNLVDMIADETIGTTEEEIIAFLTEKGHPALTMPPIIE